MRKSAFAYFLGSLRMFYDDLVHSNVVSIPQLWREANHTKTWIVGDAHTASVRFLGDWAGEPTLGVDVLDESYIAPFYWDIIRFVSSIYIHRNLTTELLWTMNTTFATSVASSFLATYQATLQTISTSTLNVRSLELTIANTNGLVRSMIAILAATKTQLSLLLQYTLISPTLGTRVFKQLSNFGNVSSTEWDASLNSTTVTGEGSWQRYISLTALPMSYFDVKDVKRVLKTGLSSLGYHRYFVLIEGPTSDQTDDVILDVMQARAPTMFSTSNLFGGTDSTLSKVQYDAYFSSHAKRMYVAYQAISAQDDIYAGYIEPGATGSVSYFVREVSMYDYGFDAYDLTNLYSRELLSYSGVFPSATDYQNYVLHSAKVLAYAHARSDKHFNSTYVSYDASVAILNCISSKWAAGYNATILSLGQSYADQIVQDFGYFNDAVTNGDIY